MVKRAEWTRVVVVVGLAWSRGTSGNDYWASGWYVVNTGSVVERFLREGRDVELLRSPDNLQDHGHKRSHGQTLTGQIHVRHVIPARGAMSFSPIQTVERSISPFIQCSFP
jgi:hypothetical protein